MAALYYVRDGRGAVTGPHTSEEIDRQASAGRLPPSWYISTDGVCWVPIHRRGQAEKAPSSEVDLFEALFAPPGASGRPSLLHEVGKTWRWYTRPRSFLRVTHPEGWRFARYDLVSGREIQLTAAEADRAIARAAQSMNWFPLLVGLLAVLWLLWSVHDFSLAACLFKAAVMVLVAGAARFARRKWGTLFVAYEIDRDDRSHLQAVRNAFATLRRCSRVWRAPSSGTPVVLGKLPLVKLDRPVSGLAVNIRIPGLVCGDLAVHFFPDKVLLVDHTGTRLLSAMNCTIIADQVEATGPEGPLFRDAEVVGRRPLIGGSSDLLPPESPGLPVLRVGLLRLGLGETQVELLTSGSQAPVRYREHFFSTPSVAGDEAVGEEALAGRSMTAVVGEGAQRWWWRFRRYIWPALRRTMACLPGRVWIGGLCVAVLALLVAGIFWWAGAGDRDIALANQLWDGGDHAAAVTLYKQRPARFWRTEGDERRNLWRVIGHDLARGDRADAAAWVDRALEHGVKPESAGTDLKNLWTEREAEHERRLAAAAAAQREREQEEETRRKQAEEEAQRPQRERDAQARAEQEAKDRAMWEEARRKREEKEHQAEKEKHQRREEEDEKYKADEARAARELGYARKLLDMGKDELGIQRLKEVVKDHPGTASAAQAKKLLQELGKR